AMLSVGIFFLTYAVLSAVLAVVWQWLRSRHQIENADTLFTLRILPMLFALLVVVLVTVPSFWSLEPSATNEGIGSPITVLFAASLKVLCACFSVFASCGCRSAAFSV